MSDLQKRIGKALEMAGQYGQIDGDHHKAWVIDQVVRALTGCPMVKREAKDCRGEAYTFDAQGESEEYIRFVTEHKAGEDGLDTYGWETGIAP